MSVTIIQVNPPIIEVEEVATPSITVQPISGPQGPAGEQGPAGPPGNDGSYSNWEHRAVTTFDVAAQFMDLQRLIIPNSLIVSLRGIILYEGLAYTLSTASGVTRMSFIGDIATGGLYPLTVLDTLHFNYRYNL